MTLVEGSSMKHAIRTPASWSVDLAKFDDWLRASHQAEKTRKLRNYQLRAFAASVGVTPGAVTSEMVVTYVGNPDWSDAMAASARAAIRLFYRWALSTERVETNPVDGTPPVRRINTRKRRAATDAEIAAGLDAADERVALMILLGRYMGLRCCEIAKVRREDAVVLGRRWIFWRRTLLTVRGKGGKVRRVPMPRKVWRRFRAIGAGYVFEGSVGGHLSPEHVSKLMSRALPDGVTGHMLRHTYATKAHRKSRNLRAVQSLLGHTSVATTQVYVDVDEAELWEAAKAAA